MKKIIIIIIDTAVNKSRLLMEIDLEVLFKR